MIFLNKSNFHNFLEENLKTNNLQGSILGIDYGSKHIGLAITDSKRKYALSLQTIDFELEEDDLFQFTEEELNQFKADKLKIEYFSNKWNELFVQILDIIKDRKIIACVIGLPLKTNQNTNNIKQHVEFFTIALDNFLFLNQANQANFEKIKFEIEEIEGIKLTNGENILDNEIIRKKIDKFAIFLQDERYTTKQVFANIKEQQAQFLHNHHLINKNFKTKYKKFDEENEKFFRDKKSKKINNLKNFKKFQAVSREKIKNTAAAVNILNLAIQKEEIHTQEP